MERPRPNDLYGGEYPSDTVSGGALRIPGLLTAENGLAAAVVGVASGGPCSPNGRIAATSATAAELLICRSGVWAAVGSGGFGAWATATFGTAYLAATDLLVVAQAGVPSGPARYCMLLGYTDAANPPTTLRASDRGTDNSGSGYYWPQNLSVTFPVRAGDYWQVVATGTCAATVYTVALP